MTPGRRSLTRLAADAPSAVSTAEPVDSVCPGPWVRATARTGRAAYAETARDTELMRADVQAAYADFERIGDRWGLPSILANRAQLRTMDGDLTGGGRLRAGLAVHSRSGIARGHHADHVRLSGRAARLGDHESARVHVQTAKDQMAGQPRLTERAMFADAVLAMALWFGDDCERARSICAELRAVVTGGPSNSPVQQHVVALVRSVTGFVAAQSGDMSTATADLQVAYRQQCPPDMPIVANAEVCAVALAHALGRAEDAAVMLGAAAKVRGPDDRTDPAVAPGQRVAPRTR